MRGRGGQGGAARSAAITDNLKVSWEMRARNVEIGSDPPRLIPNLLLDYR